MKRCKENDGTGKVTQYAKKRKTSNWGGALGGPKMTGLKGVGTVKEKRKTRSNDQKNWMKKTPPLFWP